MFKLATLNLFLRGITIFSKFLLVYYIARNMTPEELGVYGLFSNSIMLSVIVIGFDFYMYANREILKESSNPIIIIRDHLIFILISYIIFIPLLSLIFFFGILEFKFFIWFFFLLIFEHISQECYRLLVILSRSFKANFILFVRSASWIFLLLVIGVFNENFTSLKMIFAFWTFGALLSILLSLFFLKDLNYSEIFKAPINKEFIKNGFYKSIPFITATFAAKGIEFSDRYFLKIFYGDLEVGIYTFFAQIASVIPTIIITGVVTILFPKMLFHYQKGNFKKYKKIEKSFNRNIFVGVALSFVILSVAVLILVQLVNNDNYSDNIFIFWILLFASSLNAISLIPHYALYIKGYEIKILQSTIISFMLVIFFNILFVPIYGIYGAAVSQAFGFLMLYLLKNFYKSRIVN